MTLPRSALLAAWAGAAAAGRVPVADALLAVAGQDEPHRVAWQDGALPPASLPVPDDGFLSDLLVLLAAVGEEHPLTVRCALPRPGDVRGVPGPAGVRAAAVDAGECVLVEGLRAGTEGVGLVPEVEEFGPEGDTGRHVVWRAWVLDPAPPAAAAMPTSVAEADLAFRLALGEAAGELERLDVGSWRPDDAARLGEDVRRRRAGAAATALPPTVPPRSLRLLSRAEHVLAILDVAAEDAGGTLSSHEVLRREHALQELSRAVRDAVVAAVSLPG